MKKLIVLFGLITIVNSAHGETFFPSNVYSCVKMSAYEYMNGMIGDTICLYADKNQTIEYDIPDTIWVKYSKKPKLNKHYFLQYVWNGVSTGQMDKDKHPIYEPAKNPDGDEFILHHVKFDGHCLNLTDINSGRDVTLYSYRYSIKSRKNESRLYKSVADKVIYVEPQNKENGLWKKYTVNEVEQLVRVNGDSIDTQTVVLFREGGKGLVSADNQLHIESMKRFVTEEEYIEHNFVYEMDFKHSFVASFKGATDDNKSYFEGDSLFVYEIEKKIDSYIYRCYGYERRYNFNMSNGTCQCSLTDDDRDYLVKRGSEGSMNRLKRAKVWDKKNKHIVNEADQFDNDSIYDAVITKVDRIKYVDENELEKSTPEKPVKKGSHVCVTKYAPGHSYKSAFHCMYRSSIIVIPEDDIEFVNKEAKRSLKRKGDDELFSTRVKKAFYHELVRAALDDFLEESKEWDRKQIFVTSQSVKDTGYDWEGIKVKVYNCFKKTIKYIYLTYTPYNHFDDIQPDELGKTSREIRCVGPIEKGESGTFEFEDMFKNKKGIIKAYNITDAKIVFLDNSEIKYTGRNIVKSHVKE